MATIRTTRAAIGIDTQTIRPRSRRSRLPRHRSRSSLYSRPLNRPVQHRHLRNRSNLHLSVLRHRPIRPTEPQSLRRSSESTISFWATRLRSCSPGRWLRSSPRWAGIGFYTTGIRFPTSSLESFPVGLAIRSIRSRTGSDTSFRTTSLLRLLIDRTQNGAKLDMRISSRRMGILRTYLRNEMAESRSRATRGRMSTIRVEFGPGTRGLMAVRTGMWWILVRTNTPTYIQTDMYVRIGKL